MGRRGDTRYSASLVSLHLPVALLPGETGLQARGQGWLCQGASLSRLRGQRSPLSGARLEGSHTLGRGQGERGTVASIPRIGWASVTLSYRGVCVGGWP